MDELNIHVERRLASGKSEVNRLKREGLVPGILYNKDANIPVYLENDALKQIFSKSGENVFLTLNLEQKKIRSKVKEVQRDPVTREILHIDLMPQEGSVLH